MEEKQPVRQRRFQTRPIRLNSTVLQTPFDESQEDGTQTAKNVFLSNYIWDVCL